MKRAHISILALFAVFAFSSAVLAAPAFAENEWLVNGSALTAAISAEWEGTLSLTTLEGTAVLSTVQCEQIWDGSIGPARAIEITKLLNLKQEEIGTELTGLALDCTVTATAGGAIDCKLNELAEVWPDNLPWKGELFLIPGAGPSAYGFRSVPPTGGDTGYEVRCPTALGSFTELCEGPTKLSFSNNASTPPSVLASTSEITEKWNCTLLGSEKGDLGGMFDIWAIGKELERLTTAVS